MAIKARVEHFAEELNNSLWFLPLVMTVGALLLSEVMLYVDRVTAEGLTIKGHFLFQAGPAGARSVLSTVATSMISVAGVGFSITVVALSLAASQFGSRILRNFMKDKSNQVVIGMFISTFLYSISILRTVHGQEARFVPQFSITLSVIMAIASLFAFIFFIHHVSQSIQAQYIIQDISNELEQSVQRLFPETLGKEVEEADSDLPEFVEQAVALKTGYIQVVEDDLVLELATEYHLVISLPRRPGHFVTEGNAIARFSYSGSDQGLTEEQLEEIGSRLSGAFTIGPTRTRVQDAEVGFRQLVEIAVRALSPGINDPFTAIACVDHLGAAISQVGRREFPKAQRYDEEGNLRIVANPIDFEGLCNLAFHQIRQHGLRDIAVTIHLARTLCSCYESIPSSARKKVLESHFKNLQESCEERWENAHDLQDLKSCKLS